MGIQVRLKPYVSQSELLEFLRGGQAQPASTWRRLRRRGLLTAGAPVYPRTAAGRIEGEQRRYSTLNILAVALEQAGRDDDAATVARCAAEFEDRYSFYLTATEPDLERARRHLSDALETAWTSCRPEGVAELRGVVTRVGDWIRVQTDELAEVALPRSTALDVWQVGASVAVVQIATAAVGSWRSLLLPTDPVDSSVAGLDDDGEDESGLYGPGRIELLTRLTPERARVYAQLDELLATQEPSRLTLLA